jgi:hypothetical protein
MNRVTKHLSTGLAQLGGIVVCVAVAAGVYGCGRGAEDPWAADAAAIERRMRADIGLLAADELEGRGTPSRGLDLAALYLETQLEAAGVAPAGGGSYRQSYRVGSYVPAEAQVQVRINGKLLPVAEYLFINFGRDPDKGPLSYSVVDAGTGIVAEERDVNELASLDVRGKAVVARKGAPWELEPAAVFGPDRAMGKVMAATVRGAELLVYLSEELDKAEEAECKFFAEMKNAPVGFVREPEIGHVSALSPLLVVKPGAVALKTGDRIDITVKARIEEGRAANVLGKIEGTDPALRDEWVVFTAHYDHVGMRDAGEGEDGIWNGADDNASGTAGVLEVARQVARRPGKRSVLVFFTSGEDRGIFGSAWYAVAPVAPMNQVAAQFNLDMIGRSEGSVQGIAPAAATLFEEAVQSGHRRGIDVIPDQQPTWRLIYLTDNYHFARAGVPGIFFFTGTHPDYHQVTDTADKIRYPELVRIAAVTYDISRPYIDGKARPAFQRPQWFATPE